MELTREQSRAVEKAVDWYWQKGRAPIFRLFGPAGTGKTTLARIIADELAPDKGVMYSAFTGKASHVLRSKGANATTIHSLIYSPVPGLRPVRFELNRDSPLREAGLLILDEVSMVGSEIAEDLLGFDVPLLVLGDPAQLPPVGDGCGYFTDHPSPDVLLEEVHRFSLESPITALATTIRGWPSGNESVPPLSMKGGSGRLDRVPMHKALNFDQIIVGSNATRWSYIRRIRRELGRPEGMPVKGDRIIIIRNDKGLGIFNGQQFDLLETTEDPRGSGEYVLEVRDEEGSKRELWSVFGCGFRDHEGEQEAKDLAFTKGGVAATFANAITCHKAQGSEWGRVLVKDDRRVFTKNGAGFARSWMYTAVTRAQDQVVVTGSVK